MADPPKFTPKKRPKACMQSSDDGADSSVDDLCRKKFKPIAPKPFLKKDGHQSMLTTTLPVKDPPLEVKDPAITETGTASSTHNKYGSDAGSSSMPVMYGGPVFIPVRFPFPVLVPAMLNINGNQKCTCSPSNEARDKSAEGNEPRFSKGENTPQTPCPVHYSYNSSQPTYINSPMPNVQSSFMPMYMGSGSNVPTKDRDLSEKPKTSRYKYSMREHGDIYKGMSSRFPGYGDWNSGANTGKYQAHYPHYPIQANQYLNALNRENRQNSGFGRTYHETPVPYPVVPSKCDTMCQTSNQNTMAHPTSRSGIQPPQSSAANKAISVDAAVQTDTSDLEAAVSNIQRVTSDGRETNSSSVQCSLQTSQEVSLSVGRLSSASSRDTMINTMQNVNQVAQSGISDIPSSSALSNQPSNNFQSGYHIPPRSSDNPPLIASTVARSGVTQSPSNSRSMQNMSSGESNSCEDTPPRRLHGTAFSSTSEVLSSSEALQQRNYETDVIVPLRAAPSPSDAHNDEDMDRFVLSPVISESDSEDISSRNMPPAATFYRSQQERRVTDVSTLGSRSHPMHATSQVPPNESHRRNLWSATNPLQGRGSQQDNRINPPVTTGSSLGFSHQRFLPSTYPRSEHVSPYPAYHSITPYPPALSRINSMYPNPHHFSKELQSGHPKPPDKTAPKLPGSSFSQPTRNEATGPMAHVDSSPRFPHSQQRPETSRLDPDKQTRNRADQNTRETSSENPINNPVTATNDQGRGSVQSVPLQSNLASRERQQNLAKDSSNPIQHSRVGPTEQSFSTPASIRHGSSANIDPVHGRRDPAVPMTEASSSSHGLHRSTIPSSSSSGYHLPYAVPPLVCRNTMSSMHDPSSLHGLPPRPALGIPGIPPAHSFQPGGTYHSQHMYYPHYAGLHQPLGMSPSPSPSDLLSPRSCTHLHLHNNVLHSPQSTMHNLQRSLGSGYHYPVLEDRLDSCCTSRVLHSPPHEDRSIPTLLTNILHRRPGAFSHLERTAAADRSRGPLPLPSQVASRAFHPPMPTAVSMPSVTSSLLHSLPTQVASSSRHSTLPTVTPSLHSRPLQITSSALHSTTPTVTSGVHPRPSQAASGALHSTVPAVTSSSYLRPQPIVPSSRPPVTPHVASSIHSGSTQVASSSNHSTIPPCLPVTSSFHSRPLYVPPSMNSVPNVTTSLLSRSSQSVAASLRPSPAEVSVSRPLTDTSTRTPQIAPSGRHPSMPAVVPNIPHTSALQTGLQSRPSQVASNIRHPFTPIVTSSVEARMPQVVCSVDLSTVSSNLQSRPSQGVANIPNPVVVSSEQSNPPVSSQPMNVSSCDSSETATSESGQCASSSGPASVTSLTSTEAPRTVSASTSEKVDIPVAPATSSGSITPAQPVSAPSSTSASNIQETITPSPVSVSSLITSSPRPGTMSDKYLPSPMTSPSRPVSRATGNISDKYLPVEAVSIPASPAPSIHSVPTPDNSRQTADQVVKYGETILQCSRQILRESGRTVLCCWSCDYHTAEPRKMHRHQKKEKQLQKCQLCDFKADTRCKVNQHYKEVHMDKDDPFSCQSAASLSPSMSTTSHGHQKLTAQKIGLRRSCNVEESDV